MSIDLNNIESIVIVLMENRSFDHVLGYLSLPPQNRTDIDGLKADQPYVNLYDGKSYASYRLHATLTEDPSHERSTIALQMGQPPGLNGSFPMDGFVKSYATQKPSPLDPSLVMGYYTADDVPLYDFFARNFVVCDRWFSAVPAGTQPNRLMAMAGETSIDDNASFLLPDQDLVYDWLNQRNIPWTCYHAGEFPFFVLMHKWQKTILEDSVLPILFRNRFFRAYEHFHNDWMSTKKLPKVLFMEPEYTDILDHSPNDDHPPTGMNPGQRWIQSIYETLIANPERWSKTVMILTYDEHGGLYDHVSPLHIPTQAPLNHSYAPFNSTGVRVPAFVISPLVKASSVYHQPLDHTSILSFLAECLDEKQSYSSVVDERQKHLGRISDILKLTTPRPEHLPSSPIPVETSPGTSPNPANLAPGANANSHAFQKAKATMQLEHPLLFSKHNTPHILQPTS